MTCPQCGTRLEGSARFCGACGHRLSSAASAPASAPEVVTSASSRAPVAPAAPPRAPTPTPRAPTPLPSDPYVGTTLNHRFVIEEKLGEGGFGAVYRGTQLGTQRRVAVKLLHPEMTRDANVVARFRREGQVLCSLRDAHSITTYDVDQTGDGTLFIAMELLEGRSLHDLFQAEAPIAWPRVLKIMSEMCSSLEEAHALGIVHRDLKPENVYLEQRPGNDEFVKVLDFGIAKVVRGDGLGGEASPQLTATGQTLGTLEYMSPEQLMGKPLDGRSDVYALGVLAYELMTGRLPFPDAVGPAMLISAQLKKIPPSPSKANPDGHIPPEVDALILRMLEKARDQRFADMGALRREIDQLRAGGAEPRVASYPASGPIVIAPRPGPTPAMNPSPPPHAAMPPVGRPAPGGPSSPASHVASAGHAGLPSGIAPPGAPVAPHHPVLITPVPVAPAGWRERSAAELSRPRVGNQLPDPASTAAMVKSINGSWRRYVLAVLALAAVGGIIGVVLALR